MNRVTLSLSVIVVYAALPQYPATGHQSIPAGSGPFKAEGSLLEALAAVLEPAVV